MIDKYRASESIINTIYGKSSIALNKLCRE